MHNVPKYIVGVLWTATCLLFLTLPSISSAKKTPFLDLTEAVQDEDWEAVVQIAKSLQSEPKSIPEIDEVPYFLEYAEFQLLLQNANVSAHYRFLRAYPNSPYKERVTNEIAHLEFESIKQFPTVDKFKEFQTAHPESSLKAEAKYLEEDLAWQTIVTSDSVDKYRLFQQAYPNGMYSVLAKEKEAALIYREVRKKDSVDTYMAFIETYPQSHFANEARARTIDLVWKDTTKDNSIRGYQYFQKMYPRSDYTDIAKKNEKSMRWDYVQSKHDIDKYRTFELDFPASNEARTAERLEWDLFEYTRANYPDEMTPKITRIRRQDDGGYRLFLDIVDNTGEFVGGLTKDNFTVYDAGYKVDRFNIEGMEQNRSLDVVFVLDTTGSMSEEINGVKEGVIRFSEIMQLRNRDVRYALITYGDTVRQVENFTKNVYTFQNWVSQQVADGGADEPENSLDAISSGLNRRFQNNAQRIIILVTDAPSHTKNYATDYDFRDINQLSLDKDTQLYIVGPQLSEYKELSANTAGVFYELDSYNFAEKMEEITQRLSKQYKLTYFRPPFAPPVMDELMVKIRIKPGYLLVGSSSVGSIGQKLVHASYTDSNDMYRVLDSNELLCTNDGGSTWNKCGTGLPKSNIMNLMTDKSTDDIVWINDDSGKLWKSVDGGKSFLPVEMASEIISIDAAEDGGLLIAHKDSLHHLTVDEKNLHPLYTFDKDRTVLEVTSIPDRSDELLVSLSTGELMHLDHDEASIFKGPCDTKPQLFTHPSRKNTLLSICGNELWRSIDLGRNWHTVALPTHPEEQKYALMDLSLDPSVEQNNILATTHGILRSSDLGMSWTWDRREIDETSINLLTRTTESKVVLADRQSDSIFSMDPVANVEFLSNTLFFESGVAGPNEILHPHLNDLAAQMIRKPQTHLTIEGHTDSYGSDKENMKLSEARAVWIQRYLINKGVNASRITTLWYGESHPLFDNKTKDGRSKNRRVELIITKSN